MRNRRRKRKRKRKEKKRKEKKRKEKKRKEKKRKEKKRKEKKRKEKKRKEKKRKEKKKKKQKKKTNLHCSQNSCRCLRNPSFCDRNNGVTIDFCHFWFWSEGVVFKLGCFWDFFFFLKEIRTKKIE